MKTERKHFFLAHEYCPENQVNDTINITMTSALHVVGKDIYNHILYIDIGTVWSPSADTGLELQDKPCPNPQKARSGKKKQCQTCSAKNQRMDLGGAMIS